MPAARAVEGMAAVARAAAEARPDQDGVAGEAAAEANAAARAAASEAEAKELGFLA